MLQQTRFSFKIWKQNFILEQGAERLYGWKAQKRKERVPTSFCLGTLYQTRSCQNTIAIEGSGRVTSSHEIRQRIVESRWTLVREQEENQNQSSSLILTSPKKQLEAQFLRASDWRALAPC